MKEIKKLNQLIDKAALYLQTELLLSARTVYNHRLIWREVIILMEQLGFENITTEVGNAILNHKFENLNVVQLSYTERKYYRTVIKLVEFNETGKITHTRKTEKKTYDFSGSIGERMSLFLTYEKNDLGLNNVTINFHARVLELFLKSLNTSEIFSIDNIDLKSIINFLTLKENQGITFSTKAVSILRGFMKYLYDEGLSNINYYYKIPKHKNVTQPKIPSTYTTEEIEKLISSINRSNCTGKRDYAIILITTRLGLRASDISKLKFESLQWDTQTIKIKQFKTGIEVILPLLPDVGNAIIDYLKYGRPQSTETYVFLCGRSPFPSFKDSGSVKKIIRNAMKKSGINLIGRKHGPHALRHSLGSRLLEESIKLPTITEILGHKNSNSTLYYLRIDLKSMKQCILDVPPIPYNFYEQKGGFFYA